MLNSQAATEPYEHRRLQKVFRGGGGAKPFQPPWSAFDNSLYAVISFSYPGCEQFKP